MGAHFGARATTGLANHSWSGALAVFEATTLTARGRYADFIQVSLMTKVPIGRRPTVISRVFWHLRKSERFRPRGHWCTFK
jgi:hypothetical protein